jgi:glycosyltransferase involved in cell wall biosynthesis
MVVHLTASSANNASRILKESQTLNRLTGSTTTIIGIQERNCVSNERITEGIEIVRYPKPFESLPRGKIWSLIKLCAFFRESARWIADYSPTTIIAHSILTLPGCIFAGERLRVPVIYDCHELERGTISASSGMWKFFTAWLEKTFLPKASAVIVVNDSIADWYENEYGFRPYVLKAYPDARWQSVDSDKTKFRSKFGIPENDIIFLYQGLLSKGRRVEQLIDVFEQAASDRHLVFMGYGELEPLVREAASRCSRIHFHEAVPPDQLLHYTTSADVGISGVENTCLSYYYALPNKIMEYIHAGIAVLSPDFPEMRKVVLENKCGWVHEESTDSIRTQVNNLTKAEIAEKAANSVVARSSLTWESQEHVLIEVIEKVLKTSVR